MNDEIRDLRKEQLKKALTELESSEEFQKASEIKKTEFRLALRLRYHLNMDI